MDNIEFDKFFETFGLESIKEKFVENEFSTVLALTEVSDEDLKEIGVKAMGKRKQFLAAIKKVTESKDEKTGTKLCSVEVNNERAASVTKPTSESEEDDDILPEVFKPKDRKNEPTSKRKLEMESKTNEEMCTPSKQEKQQGIKLDCISNWLKSPFNPEKVLNTKKIHLYTQAEIDKVYGIRRQKMEFMNNKLKQLIEDQSVRSQSKAVIMGMAEVAWDQYNATEAKIDRIEVGALISALEKRGTTYSDKQLKTIKQGTERVNRAQSDIKVQLKRIRELKENDDVDKQTKLERINRYENELTVLHHELQKANDALRKACGVKVLQLQRMLQDIGKEVEGEVLSSEDEISDETLIDVVQSVKVDEDTRAEHTNEEVNEENHDICEHGDVNK